MINSGADGITYVDQTTTSKNAVVAPAYQVQTDIAKIQIAIQATQERIKSVFFSDLFFLLAQSDNRQKTATEIIASQRENLRLLGPIIERLNPDFLRIVIARCYDLENQAGRLPPPPEEIQGLDIKVEIISLIAQAQRLTVVTPIEQLAGMVASMSQIWPEVTDKFNADQAVDELAEALGIPSGIVNSDEVVQEIRRQQDIALQQQQQLEQAQQLAGTAKQLSETDVSSNNALTAIAGGAA
jgi:hypothetical protein